MLFNYFFTIVCNDKFLIMGLFNRKKPDFKKIHKEEFFY